MIFLLLDKCPIQVHVVIIAEKISLHARMVLRVSYDEKTFGQMLRMLSSSALRIEPFIKILVCNLRHWQAVDSEFVASQKI